MTHAHSQFARSTARSRLARGLGASALGPLTTALIQVLSVPVFLRFWGPALYGEWLMLSAIPTYLALSDLGFGSVAGNEMTMRVVVGDHEGALETFHSAWLFISAISLFTAICIVLAIVAMPTISLLHLSVMSISETRTAILLLTAYALVALQSSLILSGFRCDGNYASGMLGVNLVRISEWSAATVVLVLGGRPMSVAMTYLAVRTVGMLVLSTILRRKSPWLRYGAGKATTSCIRRLTKPAIAFMAFPVGYALNNQGMLLVVGLALGPIAVTVFATARTLTRFAAQPAEAIRGAVWPELSAALGTRNWEFARKLHRKSCQVTVWLCLAAIVFLCLGGAQVFKVWTHGGVSFDRPLFYCLIAAGVVNSLWYTSSAVALACNRHQQIALVYLLMTAISICVANILLPHFGPVGAATALLATDLAMSVHVLRTSVRISKDTIRDFILTIIKVPFLMSRIRNASAN